MTEEQTSPKKYQARSRRMGGGTSDVVYGMAFLGAAIYYIQHATSFWDGVIGILKAVFWPGFLMYKLLEYLKL